MRAIDELLITIGNYALRKGEEWRIGEGSEIMNAYREVMNVVVDNKPTVEPKSNPDLNATNSGHSAYIAVSSEDLESLLAILDPLESLADTYPEEFSDNYPVWTYFGRSDPREVFSLGQLRSIRRVVRRLRENTNSTIPPA